MPQNSRKLRFAMILMHAMVARLYPIGDQSMLYLMKDQADAYWMLVSTQSRRR